MLMLMAIVFSLIGLAMVFIIGKLWFDGHNDSYAILSKTFMSALVLIFVALTVFMWIAAL
jgi:magnesium-transporting ATPase (P-type)